jgi:hypothetical protein
MKWERDGPGYKITYKNHECVVTPWGQDGQWIGKVASSKINGFNYQTPPMPTVETACTRCLEVIDMSVAGTIGGTVYSIGR